MAVSYYNGSWWVGSVAYPTEQAARDAEAGVGAGDPSADFNSSVLAAIPTVRAPIPAAGELSAARAKRAEIERLASVPYGTPASAGGTATTWQTQAFAPTAGNGVSTARPGGVISRPLDASGNPLNMSVYEDTTGPNAGAASYDARVAVGGGNLEPGGYAADFGSPGTKPLAPLTGAGRTYVQGMTANTALDPAVAAAAAASRGPMPSTPAFGAVGAGGAPGAGGTSGAPAADQTAANDARQQQDMLIAQLVQQAGKSQAAPPVDTTGYNASRAQSGDTYAALSALSGNNISSGTGNANANQRDQTQGSVLQTAQDLKGNATRAIGGITADPTQRNASGASLSDLIAQLQAQKGNNVGDVQVNSGQYNQGRDVTADIIQRLLAEAQRPEGPSAAESLMLLGQERAERNAAGDAQSLTGGWRSQLIGQRRAQGQAAQMSSDAAAQSAALRANEETQYRTDVRNALQAAGGLQSDSSGRDLALGTTNASLLAQILQGNQTNSRESLASAANTQLGKLTSDTGFATSNADRSADIAKANQLNSLNSLLGAGNLQSSALTSDTSLAQSNAANQVDLAKANQQNSLAAQIAASNTANNNMVNDRSLATSNADRAAQVAQNNAQNSLQALQAAGVISTGTRSGDIQLSQGDQRAVVDMAIAAAQIDAQKYGAQLQYAIGLDNVAARKAELQRQYDQDPTTVEKFLGALGPVAGTLGLLGWKPMGDGKTK